MTATTVHAIGRCIVKGCKQRKRNTLPGRIVTERHRTYTRWSIPTAVGPMSPHSMWHSNTPSLAALAGYTSDRNVQAWIDGMTALGWVCPDHKRVMKVVTVAGTVNVDKTCDGRCRSATGPNCECPCGGEQHGSRWS
ncbi:hypothetical protein ABZ671_18870 [Micromonospora sp. NPDC006766]|uniref:hypothetical protein n=1 Tax=Micromonospora sp. NPDC006766 TaxID=3154778 RepID=UPI0033DB9481